MNAIDITHKGSPERFDPRADNGKLVHAEHFARYRWASQLAHGLDVLDAGCGTGYGTRILADAEPARLLAVDLAEEAIERTREATDGRAEALAADVRALPLEDAVFDLVVCFEVIEHLDRRDEALRELRRVLRPSGTLLISSPNRDLYLPGNPFHVHEYTPQELEQELRALFANVRLHPQNAWLGSVLAGSEQEPRSALRDGGAPALVDLIDGRGPARDGTFLVAVASDAALPGLRTSVVLADPFEVKWWAEQIEAARAEATTARGEGVRHSRELAATQTRLQAMATRLLELEQLHATVVSERHDLQIELEDVRGALEEARWLYERSNRVVAELQGSFSWKLTAPLRRLKSALRGRAPRRS